jgi:hypothetical protein
MQPAPGKFSTLLKPTVDTQFHIDYEWWERSDKDLRQTMIAQLPAGLRDHVATQAGNNSLVDYIDPVTAEVTQLDDLSFALRTAATHEDYITPQASVIDSIFRLFLANGNQPLTVTELGERLERPPQTILKMLSGREIYYGIRPVR